VKVALSVADMNVGGIATFVLNLCQSLGQAGHEVVVITQQPGVWWPRLAEIGVHGDCLPHRQWDSVHRAARRIAAYMVAQRVDLLLVNIGIDNRLPMMALHLLPDSLPVVLALHNDRPEVYDLAAINQGAWNCAVGVGPKVYRAALTRSPQKNIRCIPYSIALPTAEQLGERVDWSVPLRLLFVGRLDDGQKGILRLPAILVACRDQGQAVQITVIGDGPDRTQLMQACAASGVAELVTSMGFQPSDVVTAQMRTHHLLLLPSNYEGLPIVLLEAQANGCVPIASRLPGITDAQITDGATGMLVEPSDVTGFAAAICSFQTAAHWRSYSQAAIAHARQHYAVEQMGEQYVALFDALARGANALPVARSALRKQGATPFTRWDYLPQPLRIRIWSYYRRLRRHFPPRLIG
jgi:glycosyltransferase involved in cell wall biosynthesis